MEDWLAYPGIAEQPQVLQFPGQAPPEQAPPAPAALEGDEPRVVREALARGASIASIVELLLRRRYPSAPRTPAGRVMMPQLDDYLRPGSAHPDFYAQERQGLQDPVIRAAEEYGRQVEEEFDSLPPIVQAGFRPLPGESFATARQKYLGMRPLYYRAGWRCPKLIFDRIVAPSEGAALLGYPIVGGIHEEMLAIFDRLEAAMNARRAGLADRVKQQIFTVGGFVPRFIGGSSELSNHAFGLAVDLDPDWNPQFKSPEVLAALKRATGLDFAASLLPASSDQRINLIAAQIDRASERLKTWLAKFLPAWETSRAGLRALQAKVDAAKTREERAKATADLKAAQSAFNADPDLHSLDVLIGEYGESKVRAWAAYGIQTIPKELVDTFKALGARYGARSGVEYESSKDVMHLELIAAMTIKRNGRRVLGWDELAAGPPPAAPRCTGPGPGAD